jgi:hypothetical protein
MKIETQIHINKIDITDYMSMRGKNLSNLQNWDNVKNLIVSKNGDTFLQLLSLYNPEYKLPNEPSMNQLIKTIKNLI